MDNIVSQQIPHDSDAEKAVLGAIFIDPEAIADASAVVQPEDFYERANQIIFQALLDLSDRGDAIDPLTLQDELNKRNQLDDIGGIGYVSELAMSTPTAAHVNFYAQIVHRKALLRRLISASQNIITNAINGSDDVTDILDDAESEIMNVSSENNTGGFRSIKEVVNSTINDINNLPEDNNMVTGLPTGFYELDKMTTGFHDDELIIIAARPGVGKTSFAMNIATNAALNSGKKVAIFDLEMSKLQLIQRTISSVAKVNLSKVLSGELNQEEWKRIWTAERVLAESSIYLDDSSITTPLDIISKCRKLKMTEGLDLVVIDYLQLMKASNRTDSGNRVQEISEITRMLKVAAKDLNIPIILLSQLSRLVEQREDHRPILSDLRESGSIEQDADIVLFLYNPENYNDVITTDEPGTVHLIIAKHRSGATGEVKLRWVKEIITFENLA